MKPQIVHCLTDTRAKAIYIDQIGRIKEKYLVPHVFVYRMMELYHKNAPPKTDRSVHGRYFEYVVGETLAMNGIKHMYYQATVAYVSLAVFDWFLYHRTTPVSISCKTKARDRWKQAALEGFALKQVYTQATNYLITMEALSNTNKKIEQAPRSIDWFIVATDQNFTHVIQEISKRDYIEARPISPISKGTLVSAYNQE